MLTEKGISIVLAFLIGSIPFGWIIALLWGVGDIRKVGSSNIGATNVTRTAGKLAGALTFILDAAKGVVPMLYFGEAATIWIGLAAVAGHCFSPFMGFKGGKGVSTTLGALTVYSPWLGGAAIVSYALGLGITRVSALGSLFAMVTAFTGAALFSPYSRDKIAVGVMAAIVLARHKDNWNKLLNACLIAALALSGAPPAHADSVATASISDYRGKPVDTKLEPKRVAALMPNIAETVVDLGAGSRLVAVPDYARLPKDVRARVKNLGPYNHVSTEVVYASKPDLVIASMDGNSASQVLQLERLGMRVLTVNTQSLSDIVRSMTLIAAALGDTDRTKIERFEKTLLSKAAARENKPRVFMQVGWEPLVTISDQTFIAELLERAGGENVFGDSPFKYPRPNPEEVVAANPQVIIICQLTDKGDEARRALAYWKRFKNVAAVKNGRIHVVPGDIVTKPGFSLLRGFDELKKIL